MPSYSQEIEDLKNQIGQFLKEPKWRKSVDDYIAGKTEDIIINLDDLAEYQKAVAQKIIDNASKFGMSALEDAVISEVVNTTIGSKTIDKTHISIIGTVSQSLIHEIGAKDIGRIVNVHGLVNKTASIHPMYLEAVFKCVLCGKESQLIVQENPWSLTKPMPKCEGCDERTTWEPVPQLSELMDSQEFTLQESYDDISSNKIPRPIRCITFKHHILNYVNCGDDVEVLCIVNAMSATQKFTKTKFNIIYLEALSITKKRKDPESMVFTVEEELQMKELAKDPEIYNKMINSLAPSLYGHENEKEAVLLAIFGSPEEKREDIVIRGNIHILMVGDPACIVGDSRIALYDGMMPKINTLGSSHLEKINLQIFSAKGCGKYGIADEFHRYENQRIYELITESGRRLVGTYNQPLKVKEGLNSEWKCMDELKEGSEIRVATKIPCYKKTSPISKNLAALFGYMFSDGYSQKYRVGFVVNNEETDLIPIIQENLKTEFGKIATIEPKMTNSNNPQLIYYLVVNDKNIASLFDRVKILETLFNCANDTLAIALSWMFDGDGHVLFGGRGKNGIFFKQGSDKNIQILRDIQLLLLRFGIYSIVDEEQNGTKWVKIRQSNSITRFSKYIGFNCIKKRTKLKKLIGELPMRRFHDKRWEHIKIIRPIGYETVYDIHEPKYHQFVANGIIVHNTAKSQLLRSAVELSPRGMYAMGRGTTAAGLTAALHKDGDSGEWEISAGVLVLADEGVAAIDEIDKMREEDRVNIHEAMEQQTVSIDKAGYHVQLKARTAVIAAANPSLGRYDQYKSVFENLPKFPPSLFSRFDLIFKVLDIPNEKMDMEVVSHIIDNVNRKSPIDRTLLRKYVAYSKKIKPTLSNSAANSLKNYFVAVRKTFTSDQKTFPFSYRQFEALKRLTLARARSLLKQEADTSDVECVKRLFDVFLKDTIGGDVTSVECAQDVSQRSLQTILLEEFKKHDMTKNDLRNLVKCDDDSKFEKAWAKLIGESYIMLKGMALNNQEVYGLP